MFQKSLREMVFGAVAGSVLGSVLSLYPKEQNFINKAKSLSENVLENVKTLTEPKSNFSQAHLISGALIGFLAGAGSAALLTPKTGKQLRKVLSTRSQDLADLINKNGHMKKRIAKAKRAVKKKVKRAIKA